jgi:hypothetical protein
MSDVLGAHLDVEVGEFMLRVGADLDSVKRSLESVRENDEKLWRRLQFGTPVKLKRAQSVVIPASGNSYIDLGSPDSGTWWDVEAVAIGGSDYNVVAAGEAGLYVTSQSQGVSPGLADLLDFSTTLPNRAFYGHRDVVAMEREHVGIYITGATAGEIYVVTMTATSYNIAGALGSQVNVAGL